MITDNQISKIRQMSKEDLIELLDICAEELGLISPKEYMQATGIKRSTLHLMIKTGKIKSYKISEHKFPLINC
jgi:hypothetical protein